MKQLTDHTKQTLREIAERIFAVSFKFESVAEMNDALRTEREAAVSKYKSNCYAHAREYNANPRNYLKQDTKWIKTVYSEAATLITMHMDDRLGDPIWLKRITKKEIIDAIVYALECKPSKIITHGITISADAQLYYYERTNDRLQGIPPEPTGEYWSLDLVVYDPRTEKKEEPTAVLIPVPDDTVVLERGEVIEPKEAKSGVTWGDVFNAIDAALKPDRFHQDIKIEKS